MKELSIEEKAKAYDKAIEKIREGIQPLQDGSKISGVTKDFLEEVFPELKESEDEEVRKEIITFISTTPKQRNRHPKWIAWLEKQGKSSDQIHYWTEEEIEPIISDYLRGAEHYGGMIARLRCLKPKSLEKQGEQKPAVEMKTPEESLGIDSNIYNEIVDKCIYGEQKSQRMISAEAKEAMYAKTAWSEEDEAMWDEISNLLWEGYKHSGSKFSWDDIRNWVNPKLKSLRPQSTWKPSDEQIEILDMVLTNESLDDNIARILRELREQLKKLKER